MNPGGPNPSLEQLWRDEVLYLHSLWRHGPPRNPNQKPNSNNLRPSNSTTFKKENEKKINRQEKRGKKKKKKKKNDTPPPPSDVEWPSEPIPEPRKEIGWPDLDPQSGPSTRSASAEEQAKFTALHLQQKGLKASQDFFTSKIGSDNEGVDADEEEHEEDGDESEEFKVFLGIFMEDSELRSYYEKNWEGGEFCCLVCGGIGKKLGKRYKNCVALVQHSTWISKTKRKRAHRAFGQVVCRVLGWDINRLPSIVLSLGEPLGRSLAQADSGVGSEANGGNDQKEGLNDKVVVVEVVNADNEKVVDLVSDDNDQSMVCKGGSKEDDASDLKKDLDKDIVDTVRTRNGEEMDCTVSLKEDGAGD